MSMSFYTPSYRDDADVFDTASSWPLAPGAWDFDPCEPKSTPPTPTPAAPSLISRRYDEYSTSSSSQSTASSLDDSCSASTSSPMSPYSVGSEYNPLLRAPKMPTRPLFSSSPVQYEFYDPSPAPVEVVQATRPPLLTRYSALGLELTRQLPTPPASPTLKKRRLDNDNIVSTEQRGRTLQRGRRSDLPQRPSTTSQRPAPAERPRHAHRASSVPTEPSRKDLEQLAPWAQRIGRSRGQSHNLPKHSVQPAPSAFSFTSFA